MSERQTKEGPRIEIRSSPGIVEVRLPETAGTGYSWRLAAAPATVREVGRAFKDAGTTVRPIAGGSGFRVFHLEAGQQGRYELEFLLQRPWEETVIEHRVVTLLVDDDGSD